MSSRTKNIFKQNKALDFIRENSIFFILILLIIIASLVSRSFFTVTNLINIIKQVSIIGIMACGITFVFIGGNFDFSVGAIISFTGVVVVDLVQRFNVITAVIFTLILGAVIGTVNGFLVGKMKANALIVTLGTQSALTGLAFLYNDGLPVIGDPESAFSVFGRGYLFNSIPVPAIIFIFSIFLGYIVLSKTKVGRYLYMTGSNDSVAWASGIRTGNVVIFSFIVSGVFAALAAIVLSSRTVTGYPDAGPLFLFDAYTAVVVGGISLFGGRGSIIKTLAGVLIVGVLGNLLAMLGFSAGYQLFFKGLILILAVWLDMLSRREVSVA